MGMCANLILWLVCIVEVANVSATTESCVTVDGHSGYCVPLDRCNWILARASSESTIISKSECGVSMDYDSLVCCPKWRNANNCGHVANTSSVELKEAQFPWVVDVIYLARNRISSLFTCTGSLISSRYALTAAHCTVGIPFRHKPFKIRVKLDRFQKSYEIKQIFVHPNYNTSNDNKPHDVALLKLVEEVNFNKHLQPVCLPPSQHFQYSSLLGQSLTIFAAGPPKKARRKKHPIAMPALDPSVCNDIYRNVGVKLGTSQLCVGGEVGKDACPGDSGGPLMMQPVDTQQWYQVGMVSLGPQDCGGKIPGIYLNLLEYIGWIEATVDAD